MIPDSFNLQSHIKLKMGSQIKPPNRLWNFIYALRKTMTNSTPLKITKRNGSKKLDNTCIVSNGKMVLHKKSMANLLLNNRDFYQFRCLLAVLRENAMIRSYRIIFLITTLSSNYFSIQSGSTSNSMVIKRLRRNPGLFRKFSILQNQHTMNGT